MNDPKKRGQDVLRNLEKLHTNLLDAESLVSLWMVNKKATPRRLEIIRSVMKALTIVWTCRERQNIDYEFAEELHKLCHLVRFRVGQDDATELLEIAIRCDELALEVLADVPLDFRVTSSGLEQVLNTPCSSPSFCQFLGCVGDCNRSVHDDKQ